MASKTKRDTILDIVCPGKFSAVLETAARKLVPTAWVGLLGCGFFLRELIVRDLSGP